MAQRAAARTSAYSNAQSPLVSPLVDHTQAAGSGANRFRRVSLSDAYRLRSRPFALFADCAGVPARAVGTRLQECIDRARSQPAATQVVLAGSHRADCERIARSALF